jgi:hypothetical protein
MDGMGWDEWQEGSTVRLVPLPVSKFAGTSFSDAEF